jgi:ketosteroid isomerase-like protein
MEQEHATQVLSGEFEKMRESFAEDIILMAPNMPEVVGKAALAEWQDQWVGVSYDTYELTVEEIIGCGDVAFVRMSYSMSFTLPGTTDVLSDTGRGAHVLRKQPDNTWLIVRDFFHSDKPLPPP